MSKPADPCWRSASQIWEKPAEFKRGEFYDRATFRFTSAGLNVAVWLMREALRCISILYTDTRLRVFPQNL
jgi:hypothetical protein